jgi:hypothetical protein
MGSQQSNSNIDDINSKLSLSQINNDSSMNRHGSPKTIKHVRAKNYMKSIFSRNLIPVKKNSRTPKHSSIDGNRFLHNNSES